MQAVLRVVGGKNDGREIKINVPEFVIGRGEEAHLRPSSELISRNHCAIRLKGGRVEIRDMGSRNGTFVNDAKLAGVHQAKSGDRLRVGRLTFEVLIDPVVAGNKKPRVKSVAEAAERSVKKPKVNDQKLEDNISDWLNETDESPVGGFGSEETIQFSLDDPTESILKGDEPEIVKPEEDEEPQTEEMDAEGETGKKKKRKEYGKLPPRPKFSHDDSTAAAGDVLKRFFNRR